MLPTLYQAWQKDNFILQLGITKSLLCMFFFGYHIHEKAIIPIITMIKSKQMRICYGNHYIGFTIDIGVAFLTFAFMSY